nr:NlpC/P60 family protein [Amycolatopsis antarctica]
MATASLCSVVLFGLAGTAVAVPPPPPNPSDSELQAGRGEANARAGEVGQLTNQLAEAESRLADLEADVQVKLEDANKALVDMQTAQDEAGQARRDADAARVASDGASAAIEDARADVDEFVAGSYQQGSTIGSMSAYMGSDSPENLLARAQLLGAVGGSQMDALDGMRKAQTEKGNADAAARQALQNAQRKQAAAEQAKSDADAARSSAEQAQQDQASRTAVLESDRSGVEQRLFEAQSRVSGLEGQRERFEDWRSAKQAEDDRLAREAAEAAAANDSGGNNGNDGGNGNNGGSRPKPDPGPSAPAGASVEAIVARAMSQLGVVYAWGGGNQRGPTRGIRDGGVADSYGDYRKVGFDCSGLMIYAFAGVKGLAHYSGYQYTSGPRVPLSQMRRGDMLFWGRGGRIHHVALYLGNGQMVEAPHSGSVVKVSPVRYGGIMPYATRLTG